MSGPITANTLWDADKVKVIGDVTIEDNVTLTVAPGVVVEFQDYYRIEVQGCLVAVGTPAERILFTTDEPGNFVIDGSHTGCWNGLRFHDTLETNDTSRLEYCTLEYSKATLSTSSSSRNAYPYGGGAISLYNFSKLVMSRCILRNNVAANGGALFLYLNANAVIESCLFTDNHALENAAAIYCSYSYPDIVNNTVVNNTIRNNENPYLDTAAVLTFLAKPRFVNNIFFWNDPVIVYNHTQIWGYKEYCTQYNNIEGYWNNPEFRGDGLNLDQDPGFVQAPGALADYRLHYTSPCVNRGSNDAGQTLDLDGQARPNMGLVDLGAYEFSGTHTLAADAFTMPETGGSVQFFLDARPENGNRKYLLAGGISGTIPGYPLPGGQAILPVNFDLFTTYVLFPLINTAVFQNFLGFLQADGTMQATLFSGPLPPGYAGLKMYFAYCLGKPWKLASNPIEVEIIP